MADGPHHHSRRDAETFLVLGAFMTLLALVVLAGIFFEPEAHAMIVNAVAGLVLLAVGVGFCVRGLQIKKTIP